MGTEVLNQSDIDALLNAVSDPVPVVEAPPTQIFSRVRRDRDKIEIRPYDFKRPERISKDQMRALEMLHETFARNFGASLSGYLRTIVEVRVSHAAQMTYSGALRAARRTNVPRGLAVGDLSHHRSTARRFE